MVNELFVCVVYTERRLGNGQNFPLLFLWPTKTVTTSALAVTVAVLTVTAGWLYQLWCYDWANPSINVAISNRMLLLALVPRYQIVILLLWSNCWLITPTHFSVHVTLRLLTFHPCATIATIVLLLLHCRRCLLHYKLGRLHKTKQNNIML